MKKKGVLILVAVLVLSIVLVSCGGGPKATAEGFLKAMTAFDGKKMAQYVSEDLKEEVESTASEMAMGKALGIEMKYSNLKVEEEGEEAVATFDLEMKAMGESNTDHGILKMTKMDGKWVITGFN